MTKQEKGWDKKEAGFHEDLTLNPNPDTDPDTDPGTDTESQP